MTLLSITNITIAVAVLYIAYIAHQVQCSRCLYSTEIYYITVL